VDFPTLALWITRDLKARPLLRIRYGGELDRFSEQMELIARNGLPA
jgi:hypothetical protein